MEVQRDDGFSINLARWQMPFPLDHGWSTDAAFPNLCFVTLERIVARGSSAGWAAVIADEKDKRVLLEAGLAQFFQDGAHAIVEGGEHRSEGAAFIVFDIFEALFIFVRHLHRGVNCVVGQIQKERLLLMPLNERNRLAREGFGEIFLFVHLCRAAPDGIQAVRFGIHIRMRTVEEPEKFIKAAAGRKKLWLESQMPFADDAGRITRCFEAVSNGDLLDRQAENFFGLSGWAGIEFVAEALLVAASHQAGARGAANRTGDITAGETDPIFCNGIYVGREEVFAALTA